MHILSSLLLATPRLAFRRAVMKHLAASVPANDVTRIWQRTTALQKALRQQRPQHSLGVNHFLRFMEWDLALYRAAQEHGMSQEQASRLIEEINWEMFVAGTTNVFALSRFRSAKLQTRVQWILDLMFAVLFTKPFRKQAVPSDDGISVDVTVCPVAAYFQQRGNPELTRFAACNLDHRMAQSWGVKLERSQTIAEGGSHCDFRFKINPTDQPAQYATYAVVSLCAIGAVSLVPRAYFHNYFGSVSPLLAMVVIAVIGFVSLRVLQARGGFALYSGRKSVAKLIRLLALATLFAAIAIFVDLRAHFPREMNVPLPHALLFYPAMAFVVAVLFQSLPLSLLLTLRLLFGKLTQDTFAWLCIFLVMLIEPTFQVWAALSGSGLTWVDGFVVVHVFAFNLCQLTIFRREDFVAMLVFRLFYYLHWHILWGHWRLQLLF